MSNQKFTFAMGGIHPPDSKEMTKNLATEIMPAPKVVSIPLNMQTVNVGKSAEPIVQKKDQVSSGQMVGQAPMPLGGNVHASVCGIVKAVEPVSHHMLLRTLGVVIEHDSALPEPQWQRQAWQDKDPKELLDMIRQAGVVGMGGAGFPTHIKLSPPPDAKIDTLLINAAECEPYLTCDYRPMLERPSDLLEGARIIMKILGIDNAWIGVEDNKPEALKALEAALSPEDKGIRLASLQVKYPQGSEKQLIQAILNRIVPDGGLPFQVGVIVQNVGTVLAIQEAVAYGKPLYERMVTISGKGINRRGNFMMRIGTSLADIIDFLGGTTPDLAKIVYGGPMMGLALNDLAMPVTKTTSGILFLTKEETDLGEYGPCIHCGRCLSACPMGLNPMDAGSYTEAGLFADALPYGVRSCFECGCCTYACPSRRPLVQFMRLAKLKNPIKK